MKKRILGGILAITACITLSSCGEKDVPTTSSTPTTPQETPVVPTTDDSPKTWQDLHVLDGADALVDDIIDNYAKNQLKSGLEGLNSFTDNFWKIISMNLMKSNGYDAAIYNFDMLNDDFKKSVQDADVTDLPNATEWSSDANYAKFYYASRALDLEVSNEYKTAYTAYLDSKTAYNAYDEYTYPFTMSIAKALGLDSHINDAIKNTTYRVAKNSEWGVNGPEGLAWELVGLSVYSDLNASELAPLDLAWVTDYVNDPYGGSAEVSLSSYLLAYAALDQNPRDKSFDIVAELVENYYNVPEKKFQIELEDGDFSSEQIYAALMAYKVSRDKKKAVNLFA